MALQPHFMGGENIMNQSLVVYQPACKYLYCERRNAFVLKTSLFKAALKAVAVLALLAIALALRLIAISGTGTDTPDQRVTNLALWSTQLEPVDQLKSIIGLGPTDRDLRQRFADAENRSLLAAYYPRVHSKSSALAMAMTDEERTADYIRKKYNLTPKLAHSIANSVYSNAEELKLDPMILLGLIHVESTFRPNEVSSSGAMGLMQIIPSWHVKLILEAKNTFGLSTNLFTPEVNIWVGARIKKQYLNQYGGNLSRALLQYNGSLKDPEKTYYHKVLQSAKFFERELTHERL
jgi:soluble lytic murein transglycosylase-like protein